MTCSISLVAARVARARLARAGRVVASGEAKSAHGSVTLELTADHRLARGRYTLLIGFGRHTLREAVVIR